MQPHHVQNFFVEAFQHLGGRMKRREGTRWEITHAVFEEAREALRVLDMAVANAAATSRGVVGRLTLGLTAFLSTGRLPKAPS
ncbi:hypothetical protein [Brevundimonas diminuta]|uniref:hypothetical protein n=1 Tax=Brevundimonas diminuta TaxID=293 RepID=UPI000F7AB58D